jgi:hypothetical protein
MCISFLPCSINLYEEFFLVAYSHQPASQCLVKCSVQRLEHLTFRMSTQEHTTQQEDPVYPHLVFDRPNNLRDKEKRGEHSSHQEKDILDSGQWNGPLHDRRCKEYASEHSDSEAHFEWLLLRPLNLVCYHGQEET